MVFLIFSLMEENPFSWTFVSMHLLRSFERKLGIYFEKVVSRCFSSVNCGIISNLLLYFKRNVFIEWLLASCFFTSSCTNWITVWPVIFDAVWITYEAFGSSFWMLDFTLALLLLAKYDRKSLFEAIMPQDHKLKNKNFKTLRLNTHACKSVTVE